MRPQSVAGLQIQPKSKTSEEAKDKKQISQTFLLFFTCSSSDSSGKLGHITSTKLKLFFLIWILASGKQHNSVMKILFFPTHRPPGVTWPYLTSTCTPVSYQLSDTHLWVCVCVCVCFQFTPALHWAPLSECQQVFIQIQCKFCETCHQKVSVRHVNVTSVELLMSDDSRVPPLKDVLWHFNVTL